MAGVAGVLVSVAVWFFSVSSVYALGSELALIHMPGVKIFDNMGGNVVVRDDWKAYRNSTWKLVLVIPNDEKEACCFLVEGIGRQLIKVTRRNITSYDNWVVVALDAPSISIGGVPFFSNELAVGTIPSGKDRPVRIINIQIK
ncbi:MAG: hypothetical protein COW88_01410 [Candidatus Lloydbacteria bacterium CG22_combo_CG10-13_8_21_14_all_47_15]|uniref:Uncharacterized protein n=1 Tax=Candidatus Lloydbacteria bacterium CG22_combo_CG10-13_8_21_14_all_47_15 TaxID=1974635 RepID=A0A2H0CVW2_9BACT|nr:MAG: hypothetical protein COW88_01410 [Candidatus Lloydbacteria bacterium CG22_combo_CG10-13_8_21_14_all_47_15]